MNRHLALSAALLCASALSACGKDAVRDVTGPAPAARIKFFNFGVNAPGVNFYANDTKMTAISSATGTESTLGTAYGAAAAGGLYTGIAVGQYALSGRIAAATDKDLPISRLTTTIANGKYYSFYQSGFYNTTAKTVDAFIVEDLLPPVNYSVAYVRFVNAISNANPMGLWARDSAAYARDSIAGRDGGLGGIVPYQSAGEFMQIAPGIYDLYARYFSGGNAIVRKQVSFSAGAVYTVTARGDITVTSSTATNRPSLDNTANR